MMDPIIYKAVAEGNIAELIMHNADQLQVQLTPNNNTILHVAAEFGQTECVREILHKCGRSLLCSVNIKGDSSLHISARKGFASVVQQLIECAKVDTEFESGTWTTKQMLRMRNLEGDTALHEAVRRKRNFDVVEILTKEDPLFEHPSNNVKETPLFLAAERSNSMMVSKILKNCTSPSYRGPNGRTALHAAIINNDLFGEHTECIKILYLWKPSLITEAAVFGWRPLHYAALQRDASMVRQLLDMDKSIAYLVAEEDEKKTALHVAASLGNTDVMEEILLRCPDCWEMNNSNRQNIFHIAAECEVEETINFILKNSFAGSLINQKDIDGNTPLHLLAANSSYYKYGLSEHPEVDEKACNNYNITAHDIHWVDYSSVPEPVRGLLTYRGSRNKYKSPPKMKKKASEEEQGPDLKTEKKQGPELKKIMETQLIVATLVATVTFAAGFTVPGGYDGYSGRNQGMAVLARRAAFIAFVLADSMAMVLSITSVLIHVFAYYHYDELIRYQRFSTALWLTLAAMVAMVVASMTGFYVVLAHSLGLAITVCLICTLVLWRNSSFINWGTLRHMI